MNNSDALNRVMDILQKQAPVAWSKTQLVAQVDAQVYLLVAAIVFVLFGIASYILLRSCQRIAVDGYGNWSIMKGVLCAAGVILAVGSFIALMVLTLSRWAWVTAVNPSLGAAHLILAHFGIS